ncbi:S8 family serine peptidase [Nocardioides sp. YIM 152315]|uniref:S8 family serine peptidase n=1 Tax=Nocardioides sp. YIM 152315 TaxID=3031760 RepID=UPI0023DA393E|nr:S8 family serine peptidase [Nocardioides sp. YIM 152315]MDF1604336.1 S8 family serine peptidase [Nocardioides sp. YIM 152315]
MGFSGLVSSVGRLVVAGVVAAALLAAPPGAPAGAAPASDDGAVTGAEVTAGRYVVLLREPAATGYAGGTGRYRATRSTTGQFNARSARVAAYSAHLRRAHAAVARDAGAEPVRDFTIAANGFVADLTTAQVVDLSSDRRVLLVEKSRTLHLDTWRSPKFLGLTGRDGAWARHGGRGEAGAGVVIGDLDSGIWPQSKSFEDKLLSKKPKTTWDISRHGEKTRMEKVDGEVFRGRCDVAEKWDKGDCNTKIIGARYYADSFLQTVPEDELAPTEQLSARDGGGHGTHTASTAAGGVVEKVKTEGRKFGRVVGMAPAARLAVYKVCWEAANPDDSGCNNADSIAAIEQAVIDGVDVINFSIGGGASPTVDAVEIAFEGAAEAGIFVATSAGNAGPDPSTLDHPGPWLTTVAATTHYNYENTIVLANGKKIVGASVSTEPVPSTRIVDASKAPAKDAADGDADICGPGSLDDDKVEGRIVICLRGVYDRVAKSAEVKRAGGVAMILVNPSPNSLDADFHAVPTIHISDTDGTRLYNYLGNARSNARASFVLGNQTKHKTPLPQVAGFSSRGPALVGGGDILKPDVSAPGVSVLAAVSPPSNSGRRYDLYSGTSMASPHIAGLAAFIHGVRPGWSPMEIKSALMTTAKPSKTAKGKKSKDALAQGAGQVRPRRSFDPGLFVTSTPVEWRGFLTGQGVPTGTPPRAAAKVNLPSLADGAVTARTTLRRTFRATRPGVWKISASVPGFKVKTSPARVRSDRRNDAIDVKFVFERTGARLGRWTQGAVVLDGPTSVRLPVALRPVSVAAPTSVSGAGTSGSLGVPLTAGFTGDLDVTARGLAASTTVNDTVAAGEDDYQCVTVTPDTTLARFQVDAVDDTADLDLTVLESTSCNVDDAFAVAGQSGTASGDEAVTLRDPEPGTYLVEVAGFSAGDQGSPMAYAFDFWGLDPAATAGGLQLSPDPTPVRSNRETSVSLSWTGLSAGVRYLGYLSYPDSDDLTLVRIDG